MTMAGLRFGRYTFVCAAALVCLLCAVAGSALATPQPAANRQPIEKFAADFPLSTKTVSHVYFDNLLEAAVRRDERSGINLIFYDGLGEQAVSVLEAYLRILQRAEVSKLNRAEQLAFWLNLYNAGSLYKTLGHLPARSSIEKKYLPDQDSSNGWREPWLTVEGVTVSLNDVQYRILYAYWPPELVVYGLSCPALGCPDFPTRAYRARDVEERLRQAARDFVNRNRNVRLKKGKLRLSSLYLWQRETIWGDDQSILNHLRAHAEGKLKAALASVETIHETRFDWHINALRASKSSGFVSGKTGRLGSGSSSNAPWARGPSM